MKNLPHPPLSDTAGPPEWAKKLTQLRKKRGLTQAVFGNLVGVSQASVTDWERGKNKPKVKSWDRISTILHEDVSRFLYPDNIPHDDFPHKPLSSGRTGNFLDLNEFEQFRSLVDYYADRLNSSKLTIEPSVFAMMAFYIWKNAVNDDYPRSQLRSRLEAGVSEDIDKRYEAAMRLLDPSQAW